MVNSNIDMEYVREKIKKESEWLELMKKLGNDGILLDRDAGSRDFQLEIDASNLEVLGKCKLKLYTKNSYLVNLFVEYEKDFIYELLNVIEKIWKLDKLDYKKYMSVKVKDIKREFPQIVVMSDIYYKDILVKENFELSIHPATVTNGKYWYNERYTKAWNKEVDKVLNKCMEKLKERVLTVFLTNVSSDVEKEIEKRNMMMMYLYDGFRVVYEKGNIYSVLKIIFPNNRGINLDVLSITNKELERKFLKLVMKFFNFIDYVNTIRYL